MFVPPDLADFALELARLARRETLPRFAAGVEASDKGGREFDPVTEADREAERAMREAIAARFPDHGIRGEEFGDRPGDSRWSWSLDPVDGTRSFICGLPSWVTLIALLDQGRPVLGVIDAPVLNETNLGHDKTARVGDQPASTSGCVRLADARLSTTDPCMFGGADASGFDAVRRAAKVARYGLDGYAYARLAAGRLDLVIENQLKPHDYNALIPVIRASGGHIGDWRGGEDFGSGAVVAAASRALYDEAVALLRSA
ncbi:inositol monophosphatase family protein [Sphingomonas ginkgonis]|uniref:Inositol monophosphatase family protein n=1 Tax=Sphingomonas ginkgonis TaxID=2315330 RepID=A0A429V6D3_9SPHN|nr:inositol monophosphatase family protein [Sphingomonas ginkgonis]RST29493.1 inositol monophosphatase family protein [Sphingomonas ginkgonis]